MEILPGYKFYAHPEGPLDATLAIVAEKYGKDEHDLVLRRGEGRPLIGATGRAVDRHLVRIGTSRDQVYLTNSIKFYNQLGNPTPQEVFKQSPLLWKELLSLPKLRAVVAMGESALNALSGFQYQSITKWRGSILESVPGIPIIPTFHPSFYMHGEWRMKPVVEFDLARAFALSRGTISRQPRIRDFYLEPSFDEAVSWLEDLNKASQISFDIECFKPQIISCLGFAPSPERGYNIPFCHSNRKPYWPPHQAAQIWKAIALLFANPNIEFIAQNGLFDTWHLWRYGINTKNMGLRGFDTLYSHRVLMPGMPHDLGFLTSIYTNPPEPYYKDESGDWTSEIRVPDRQFWSYNIKDCCITHEVATAVKKDMQETHLLDYYQRYVHPLWNLLADTQRIGMRIDTEKLQQLRLTRQDQIKKWEFQLQNVLGWLPNTRSRLDMEKVINQLKITPLRTAKNFVKADIKALAKYAHENPQARSALVLCKDITDLRTDLSNFLTMRLDTQNRYHPKLDLFKAQTGRLASEGDYESGPQIQNFPGDMRVIVLPDYPEHELTQADMSQAEKRYVAYASEDPILLEAFRLGKDVHRVMGCIFFRGWNEPYLPPDDLLLSIRESCTPCEKLGVKKCNHSERYMAKQGGHAFSYLQGEQRFMQEQSKKNIFIPYLEAKRIRSLAISPSIHQWHSETREELKKSLWFENPLGLRREFYGLRDEEMLRKVLSWKAQSTVGSIISRAMLRLEETLPHPARIITQTHDSVLISHPIPLKPQIDQCLQNAFLIPVTIKGRELIIPIDISHGPNWGDQH